MSMGNNNRWLKARKRHQILIAKIQRIAGGSLIAALIVGPLIYFSVVAMPLEMRDNGEQQQSQEIVKDVPPTGEIGVASAPEFRISSTPIPLPDEDSREIKIIAKSENKKLKLEPKENLFKAETATSVESKGGDLPEAEELSLESFFGNQDAQIKKIQIGQDLLRNTQVFTPPEPIYDLTGIDSNSAYDPNLELATLEVQEFSPPPLAPQRKNENRENEILIIENLTIKDGPSKINKKDDAKKASDKTLQQYLRSEFKSAEFRIFNDTSILDKNKKTYQFVLSDTKQNNGKWYVTYQQYTNGLPVFDGDVKLIFTDEKKLLTISDNIKRNLPDESEFKIGKAVVTQNVKEVFEWDDSIDEIEFIDKGYFEGQPAYRASTNAHDPLGDWDIFVDGVEGDIESMTADIRLQDAPSTPQIDYSPTPQPSTGGTDEPQIEILDALFSQILGTIYSQTPNDDLTTEPLSSAYTYTATTQYETDDQGYFENESMEWYSTFLDGPNVTVHDDDATSNMEIVHQSPEDPFTWDENSANLASINAFYHTNKIHDYFVSNHGYEVGESIPLTVNSALVDAYIDGCGAWFNNTEKTIEMGRGGTASCPADLNYALGSDTVYHEYAHFIIEDITHLPNILGAESAAMGEGIADYFAATINNDPMWGDRIYAIGRRNLHNTLNYKNDMLGQPHHDGMILSGALWDLRDAIGQEAADELVFNTLFQDRYHFETFMYGMIVEDDDNDDFSDGTPHLIEIITAFDNHGIGPGVDDFNGLPLTPEAWIELFGEIPPEGEEDELLRDIYGSGCSVVGNTLTVTGACVVYNAHTFYDVYVNNGGTLYVGYSGYSTTTNTLTIEDDLTVYAGGRVYVGADNLGYSSRIYFTNVSGTPYFTNYGIVTVREDNAASNYIYGSSTTNRPQYYGYGTGSLSLWDNSWTSFYSINLYSTHNIDVGEFVIWPQIPPASPILEYYRGYLQTTTTVSMNDDSTIEVALDTTVSSSFSIGSDLYMHDAAEIQNTTGGSMSVGGGVLMRDATHINNEVSFTIYDDLTMSNEISGAVAVFDNSGTVTATASSDNTFYIQNDCTFNNEAAGTVDLSTSAVDANDGVINVFDTADWNNYGELDTTRLAVGDYASSGGGFYNKSGGDINVSNCAAGITVYRGEVQNQSGSTAFTVPCGQTTVTGLSGDPGSFSTYDTSSGRFNVEGYGDFSVGTGGSHTASSGRVQEAGDGRDGTVTVYGGGSLDVTTMNIGYDIYSGRAGTLTVWGEYTGTTLNILEDTGIGGVGNYSDANDDYELDVGSGGYVHPTTINLGSATDFGGEILNRAGDGTKGGTAGIVSNINLFSSGEIFNGEDRNEGLLSANSEINYEITPTHAIVFQEGSSVSNKGKVGGDNISTSATNTDVKYFWNKDGATVDITNLLFFNTGYFYNGEDATIASATLNVNNALYILGNSGLANYGDATTLACLVGHPSYVGGLLYLLDRNTGESTFNVTGGGTSLQVLDGGLVTDYSGAGAFNVSNATSTVGVAASTGNTAKIEIKPGATTPIFNSLGVGANGTVEIGGATTPLDAAELYLDKDLTIGGASGEEGVVEIDQQPSVVNNRLFVTGVTTVQAYGRLINNSGAPALSGGFIANDLVTVETDGNIESDGSSYFHFSKGLTTAGTVEIADDAQLDDNSISGYALEVTGGETTLGNIGLIDGSGVVNSSNIHVSNGGTFTAYSDLTVSGDVDVTGSTTEAFFNTDEYFDDNCETTITGYFDITSAATVTIACENTSGFIVQSNSPGGNTQVEGTLILNTNLETETMVVGDGASAAGTVEHDLVDDTWTLGADEVFLLNVSESLTINNNGVLDVSAKSEIGPDHTAASDAFLDGRAGSYGGMGQYEASQANGEYGLTKAHRLNFDNQTGAFTYGLIVTGSTSGAKGEIMYSGSGVLYVAMISGYFQDNEIITDSSTGSAQVNGAVSRSDFGQWGIGNTYDVLGDKSKLYHGGLGGGTMTISVGTDADSDGFIDSGIFDIKSGGKVWSNGEDFADGAGSGGSIDIYTYQLTGGGTIMAVGGSSTSALGDKTAGGGGVVRIEYLDKDSFTGTVRAYGGLNTSGQRAGTGPIFYKLEDKWQNQNDGTVVIDAYETLDRVDVDMDGNTATTDVADMTEFSELISLESLQVDRYAGYYPPRSPRLFLQQCLEANGGVVYYRTGEDIVYNRDHGLSYNEDCIYTPDPPAEQLINNSLTGTFGDVGETGAKTDFRLWYDNQTQGFNLDPSLTETERSITGGTSGDTALMIADEHYTTDGILTLLNLTGLFQDDETITDGGSPTGTAVANSTVNGPIITDVTPALSAIHKDATLDRTGTVESPHHDVYEYQLIVGSSINNVWNDTAMANCNIDSTRFPSDYDYSHDVRTGSIASGTDIVIPELCAANMSAGNTYYWKIRFLEDMDDVYATTTDQYWGLWSPTNQFYINEGGTIIVGDCSNGTLSIDLGNTPTGATIDKILLPTDHFDAEFCEIHVETTAETGIHAMKNQLLTHTNATKTLNDLVLNDGTLDGLIDGNPSSEVGFYIELDQGGLIAKEDPNYSTVLFTTPWHKLPTDTGGGDIGVKVLVKTAPVIGGKFYFWLGSYVINDTIAGIYSSQGTLTITDNNP